MKKAHSIFNVWNVDGGICEVVESDTGTGVAIPPVSIACLPESNSDI